MKKLFPLTLFLLLAACSWSPGGLAPRDIAGHTLACTFKESRDEDVLIVGKTVVFTFNSDLTYTSKLGNDSFQRGNYAYNKTGSDSADIQLIFSLTKDGSKTLLELVFSSPGEGSFYTANLEGLAGGGSGTFKLSE